MILAQVVVSLSSIDCYQLTRLFISPLCLHNHLTWIFDIISHRKSRALPRCSLDLSMNMDTRAPLTIQSCEIEARNYISHLLRFRLLAVMFYLCALPPRLIPCLISGLEQHNRLNGAESTAHRKNRIRPQCVSGFTLRMNRPARPVAIEM